RLKYIGPKDLGGLATESFCERCFWIERHFGPFPARFPGIFNVLDNVSKKSVYRSLVNRKKLPDWLELENVVRRMPVEELGKTEIHRNQKFLVISHPKSGWILRGGPDAVFQLKDGTLHIVDFKTARFSPKQDELFPMYEIQLNGYAILIQKFPISKLSLIYCEPATDLKDDTEFNLPFSTKIVDVDLKPKIIPPLLIRAREIVAQKNPPPAKEGCRGTCFYVDKITSELDL
ncbi:MAG: PD-(D/E)XK nuclease family protein, partial [Patescibacteria group bacterium]